VTALNGDAIDGSGHSRTGTRRELHLTVDGLAWANPNAQDAPVLRPPQNLRARARESL
jgi:hypothetical protein